MANSSPDEVNSEIYYCSDLESYHDSYICPYAHAPNVPVLKGIDVRRMICSFNLAGRCKYKKHCMFGHLDELDCQKDGKDEQEVAQDESNRHRLDEPVSARNQSSENVNNDCLELVNGEIDTAEQFEQILISDESQLTEVANRYDSIPGSTEHESYALAEESFENSDEDLETENLFPNEKLSGNLNSTPLESIVANSTSLTVEDTSTSNQNLILNAVPTSIRECKTNVIAQNKLEIENNEEVKSDSYLELVATNESSILVVEDKATTSQSSNNVNEKLEPVPIVPVTRDCGICREPIETTEAGRRALFGILPNCNHTFCLSCIKKWRDEGNKREISPSDESLESLEEAQEAMINAVDPETARSCPVCRRRSHFVVPSSRWIEDDAEKTQLIAAYKAKCSKINCFYFRASGECKFGKSCFYLHAAFYSKVMKAKYNYE